MAIEQLVALDAKAQDDQEFLKRVIEIITDPAKLAAFQSEFLAK